MKIEARSPCRGSCHLKTSRLPTNLTLIAALSFCTRPVGKCPLTALGEITGDNHVHGKQQGNRHARQGRTREAVNSRLWFGRALRCHPAWSHRAPSPHASRALAQSVLQSVSHGSARR